MSQPGIRPAERHDLAVLRDIERAAGQQYRQYGLDTVADDEPASAATLQAYADDGRAWVAVDRENRLVGYIIADIVDGAGHIEQVSVDPDSQGRGIGRQLIERVHAWATSSGLPAITLTTFGHIPWNRPLYEHLGFRVLRPGELTPGLLAIREAEAEHGLDPELRVVMRLDL